MRFPLFAGMHVPSAWAQLRACKDPRIRSSSGWWFGTFFIFPYIGNNHPNWLIFFRGVQTTNQCFRCAKIFSCVPASALALNSSVAENENSCSGYAGFRPCLVSTAPRRQGNAKTRVLAIYARFGILPGFRPRWALSWRESGIAVPATLVFGLGCFPRSRGARETPKRA